MCAERAELSLWKDPSELALVGNVYGGGRTFIPMTP